jgi:hypothetical protein
MMRDTTRSDIPHGAEAQCPICWRIFTRDGVCEKHKPYASPKTPECKDPATLGFVRRDRRGVAVWSGPPAPDGIWT